MQVFKEFIRLSQNLKKKLTFLRGIYFKGLSYEMKEIYIFGKCRFGI